MYIEDMLKRIEEKLDAILTGAAKPVDALAPLDDDDLTGGGEAAKVTLADVQDATLAAAGRNKPAAKAVYAKYQHKTDKKAKAARATELREEDYAAALADLNKVK